MKPRPPPRPARTRGFTLLELIVGSTVALLVFSAASQAMVDVDNFRRISTAKAQLSRDSEVAFTWLRKDFNGVGLVTFTGSREAITGVGDSVGTGSSLMSPIVRGVTTPGTLEATQLRLLTDVPRPDTNFDGFAIITDDALQSPFTTIGLLTELNGRVNTPSTTPRPGALDTSADCASNADPGCPWAFRKYSPDSGRNTVQVLFPNNNNWVNARISSFAYDSSSTPLNVHTVTFTSALPRAPNNPVAAGRIIQADRVGYQVITDPEDATRFVLQRRQCWGVVQPEQGDYLTFGDCGTGEDTGWMTIARSLETDQVFAYFQSDITTAATSEAQAQSVQVSLTLAKSINLGNKKRVVREAFRQRFDLAR